MRGDGICRSRTCAGHVGAEAWHGTATGYDIHGCRCESCSGRKMAQQRAYRARARASVRRLARGYVERNSDTMPAYRRSARRRYRRLAGEGERRGAWSAAEDAIAMSPEYATVEAAKLLGRTYDAVLSRRKLLRKRANP